MRAIVEMFNTFVTFSIVRFVGRFLDCSVREEMKERTKATGSIGRMEGCVLKWMRECAVEIAPLHDDRRDGVRHDDTGWWW